MAQSHLSLTVEQLLQRSGVSAQLTGDVTTVITGITQDSRSVQPGDLYCSVRGKKYDGNQFVESAIRDGAVAVLTDSPTLTTDSGACVILVPNVREVLGVLARELFNRPNELLTIVGITGTNGKTSTAAILGSVVETEGHKVRVFGTLTGDKTTPEAIEIYSRLHQCVADGVTHVVMEVSSHALAQGRVNGIEFAVGIFTNIGQDHLDFHGTMENYFAAKSKLFDVGASRVGVVNGDDEYGRIIKNASAIPIVTFGRQDVRDVHVTVDRVSFTWNSHHVVVNMGGQFTVMNALAAIAAATQLGVSEQAIVNGCKQLEQVPGRFESVHNNVGIGVVVDFAHTPEGLQSVLTSVNEICTGKTIVVFGCGGDRDVTKRPKMGAIAQTFADTVVVTSDNPRSEDPQAIIDEIVAGIADTSDVITLVDRAEAIKSAISLARRGDIVVIAGKGHEATQEIKGVKTPFSDVDHARQALAMRKGDDK